MAKSKPMSDEDRKHLLDQLDRLSYLESLPTDVRAIKQLEQTLIDSTQKLDKSVQKFSKTSSYLGYIMVGLIVAQIILIIVQII